MKKISLAICAKNEERSIVECFNSLIQSGEQVRKNFNIFYYVCFNGTTDSSQTLFNAWLEKACPSLKIKIFNLSESNLVEAQRTVHKHAVKQGCKYFGFFDADISIDKKAVEEMLVLLDSNPTVITTYAVSKPLNKGSTRTIIEKIANLYDSKTTIYSERKHLHGRAFITKNWDIPITDPPLLIDDVYLSFYYLDKYGPHSIKKCTVAKVYFRQVKTVRDYYRVYRRRNIEVEKCLTLFPDFKKLPPDQINRRFLWLKYIKSENIFLWTTLFVLKIYCKIRFKIERIWSPITREQWKVPITTKRVREKPLSVLIEGLDCSGKKTLARRLNKIYAQKGIASFTNIGPYGPIWYKKISEIVSLNRFPNFLRSFVYSFEIIIGKKEANINMGDIVFQISSVLRSSSYAKIEEHKLRWLVFNTFSSRVPKYDIVIYLKASYSERKRRHISQLAAKENPDTINQRFKKAVFFEKLDNFLQIQLSKFFGGYYVFNTVDLSIDEILTIITVEIDKKL